GAVIVIARKEFALVDPQFTVKEMQLFYARVPMRYVTPAWRQPNHHTYPFSYRVGREQLALNAWRDLSPFRLRPMLRRRWHGFLSGLRGDAKRKTPLQGRRRTQHIGGPGDEAVDYRAEAFQL